MITRSIVVRLPSSMITEAMRSKNLIKLRNLFWKSTSGNPSQKFKSRYLGGITSGS
jgi:hypothetical protein